MIDPPSENTSLISESGQSLPLGSSDQSGLLWFFVGVAFIEGSIQVFCGIWWAVVMNVLLVLTGTATLLKPSSRTICFVTYCVWFASAAVGLVLFGIFYVIRGRETVLQWCLSLTGGNYLDTASLTISTCNAWSSDGTLQRTWIGIVVMAALFGLPFMYVAVRTVYRFYAAAA